MSDSGRYHYLWFSLWCIVATAGVALASTLWVHGAFAGNYDTAFAGTLFFCGCAGAWNFRHSFSLLSVLLGGSQAFGLVGLMLGIEGIIRAATGRTVKGAQASSGVGTFFLHLAVAFLAASLLAYLILLLARRILGEDRRITTRWS